MAINLREAIRARGQCFDSLALMARIKKNEVADVLGVHEATVRRWRRSNSYPEWAWKLMAYHAEFFIWEGWEGWFIDDGLLYCPEQKYGFTPHEVSMIGFYRRDLHARYPQR